MTEHTDAQDAFEDMAAAAAGTGDVLVSQLTTLAALKNALPAMSPRNRTFAESLLKQATAKGSLSDKQWYWVGKLTTDAAAPRRETVQIGDLNAVIAFFDRAKVSRPKVVFAVDGTPVKLSVAGERAAVPGSINVASPTYGGAWYGRITRDGVFHPGRDADKVADLVGVLRRFAVSPEKVAAEYGAATGSCSFCSRELTDARSVTVGYGPVCAGHYGLPWGE